MDTYPEDFHEYENENPFFPEDDDWMGSQNPPVALDETPDVDLRPKQGKKSIKKETASDEQTSYSVNVLHTLRECINGFSSADGGSLCGFLKLVKTSLPYSMLQAADKKVYDRLIELLVSAFSDAQFETVDLSTLPEFRHASKAVQDERDAILATTPSKSPSGEWRALIAAAVREASAQSAAHLAEVIANGETDEVVLQAFRNIVPPTTSSETTSEEKFHGTALEWQARRGLALAGSVPYRISSGWYSLDRAFTGTDGSGRPREALGTFGPGEFHVIAAATGNGKSAAARRLIVSMAADLRNWGITNPQVLIAITEEDPAAVMEAADLNPGQPNHYLAENITVANVGASRKRIALAVYDMVAAADKKASDTGMPITACGLPYAVVIDYIGGVSEPEDGPNAADTVSMKLAADLGMRGIAQWDPYALEMFSGISYAEHTGRAWPKGMEFFKPAVLAFAQFRKLADPVYYDPEDRNSIIGDYTVEDVNGKYAWNPQPGDFRVPTKNEIRGSGVLANHATSIIILHRSRPENNPLTVGSDGRKHLADTRARFVFAKTRNAVSSLVVPMKFDSNPSGFRGMFYDSLADKAIDKGLINPAENYRAAGDPVLPARPSSTPFDTVSYA